MLCWSTYLVAPTCPTIRGVSPIIGMPLRQRARSWGTLSSNRPIVGPPRSPASSSGAPRSKIVVGVPCSRTSEPIPPVDRGLKVRPHHRQRASKDFWGGSSAAVTGMPPLFEGTSVWLSGRNIALAAAEIDRSAAFVRISEVVVITRSYKMRAQQSNI